MYLSNVIEDDLQLACGTYAMGAMILDRSQIEQVVDGAVDQVNEVLLDANNVPKNRATVLIGPGAILDSMGFVNFVVAVEDQLAERFGFDVNLVEELNLHEPT